MPQVMFIERAGITGLDEHPGGNVQKGAADAASIVNEFLQSPAYTTSAFILTYDEPGGQYDHVPPFAEVAPDNIPPMLKDWRSPGQFRLLGVTRSGNRDFPVEQGALRVACEAGFDGDLEVHRDALRDPSLTARDAAQDDMEEFFNFSAVQIPTPPALPIQPTSGVCNKNLEKAPGF